MKTWEYKRVSLKVRGGSFRVLRLPDNCTERINLLGQEGWELVKAIPLQESLGRTAMLELIFKREKE